MVGDRVGKRWHLGASAQHPPAESGERAADHRTHRASHRAAAGDAGQQRAERVVVGQMLDEAQQQRGAQAGDPGQEPDEDDAAAELEGAPTHALNLCAMTGALYRNGLDCIVLVSLIERDYGMVAHPGRERREAFGQR